MDREPLTGSQDTRSYCSANGGEGDHHDGGKSGHEKYDRCMPIRREPEIFDEVVRSANKEMNRCQKDLIADVNG